MIYHNLCTHVIHKLALYTTHFREFGILFMMASDAFVTRIIVAQFGHFLLQMTIKGRATNPTGQGLI